MIEPKPILIMIADDHPVVRKGFANFINLQPDMRLVAEASDGFEAIEQFERWHPEVVMLDLRMPRMGGIECITTIRQKDSGARIIVLSAFDEDESIYRSLQAGAKGYLRKDADQYAIIECIHAVHQGKSWIQPYMAFKLANRANGHELSPREKEVLRLVVRGKSNKEIAFLLGITEGTTKIHVNHLMRKLGVTGRTEAVSVALKRGVVPLD